MRREALSNNGLAKNAQWCPGVDQPTALTPDVIRAAVREGHTIVTRGPFLEPVGATVPAAFDLDPDADAVYVVVAAGDTPMSPIWSKTPWAVSGAIRVDVGGDGWTPPKPPLVVE